MTREILISTISGVIGALLVVIGGASLGWFDQYIKDTQVQLLSNQIINEPQYRDTLLDKMALSGKFKGPEGKQGPTGQKGGPGPQGTIAFDPDLGGPNVGAFVFKADNGHTIHWTSQGWFCIYAPDKRCFNVGSKR